MSNLQLNRQQLSEFLKNPQTIKAFEDLFLQVTTEQPSNVEAVQLAADNASAQAAQALTLVAELAAQIALAMVPQEQPRIEDYFEVPREKIYEDVIDRVAEQIVGDLYAPPTALGSVAEQNANAVKLTGGSIDGVNAGSNTALTYLRVVKALAGEVARFEGDTNDAYVVVNQTNAAAGTRAVISLRKANGTMANISSGSVGDTNYEAFGASSNHVFYTAGTERARIDATGLKVANRIIIGDYSCLIQTTAAMFNAAGASTATLTNAPVAGNPTKWIPIIDNGVTRYVPVW